MNKLCLVVVVMICCAGCFPTGDSDPVLEAYVRDMVDTNDIVTLDNFGQTAVNIASEAVFTLTEDEQKELARKIAYRAIVLDEDRRLILVAFSKVVDPIQMISFAWRNDQGNPVLSEKQYAGNFDRS